MKSKYQFPISVINAKRQIEATMEEIHKLNSDAGKVENNVTLQLIRLRVQVLELKLEEDAEMIKRFTDNGVFSKRERDYILGEGEYK